MRRRELSKLLTVFAAGAGLVARRGRAQETRSPPQSAPQFPRSSAESAANVVPQNYSYAPGDIRRYGANASAPDAANRAALQTAIAVAKFAGTLVVVPPGISYGYKMSDPKTHPDLDNSGSPIVVQDYGPGETYSGFPRAYDGAQLRLFFHTPQTTRDLRFQQDLRKGATSATLATPWPFLSGPWKVAFSTSDVRLVNLTQGTATASWSEGLAAAAGATARCVDPSHDGNALRITADWHPYIAIDNTANLRNERRTAIDNRRASLVFYNDGKPTWRFGQGTLASATATDSELSNFVLEMWAPPAPLPRGGLSMLIVDRATGNFYFNTDSNGSDSNYHLKSRSAGYINQTVESLTTTCSFALRTSTGATDDVYVKNLNGAFVIATAGGDALRIRKTSRTLEPAAAVALKRIMVPCEPKMTIDASLGNLFIIEVTDARPCAFAAPLRAVEGQRITLRIRNVSAGKLGELRFDPVFNLAPWTQPGPASSRAIDFDFDGTHWTEICRTPGDVPIP